MARFDCWVNPIEEDCEQFPFVLEIHSDLLHAFSERVIMPLAIPAAFPGMTDRFNPAIEVSGSTYRLHPLGIAVFHRNDLREYRGSASEHGLAVETAIDMLLRGY